MMGRPKKGAKSPAKKAASVADERVVIIHLKGSPAYAEWLDQFHQETRLPKATLFRWAMAEFAKTKGRPAPPEI